LEGKNSRALSGLTRSLVSNMVNGVEKGFERVLEISGIGYRAALNGNRLEMSLGFSHPIKFDLPQGVTAAIDRNTVIRLFGVDKELLGQTAASIRRIRPPESYKGKGIKYAEERLRLKAGKTGTK
jgi:large subunit ribosomal protein L6